MNALFYPGEVRTIPLVLVAMACDADGRDPDPDDADRKYWPDFRDKLRRDLVVVQGEEASEV